MGSIVNQSMVKDLIRRALEEDVGAGDVTSLSVVPEAAMGRAVILSRGNYVVAGLNPLWEQVLHKLCGRAPLVVGHRIRLNFKIDYPQPETIGADRLADAAAAWARYKGAVIVADFGTALTFDVITGDGRYTGGVIAPGLPLMTDYLAERTALLPQIGLGGRFGSIGRSTSEAMQIGAMVGYRGMVREILMHLKAGMKEKRIRFCATGGYAGLALKGLNTPVEILPELTLDGLVLLKDWNR